MRCDGFLGDGVSCRMDIGSLAKYLDIGQDEALCGLWG